MSNRTVRSMALLVLLCASRTEAQPAPRPFGTLREQAAMQQDWLRKRLDTFLPAIMRKHAIDMWSCQCANTTRIRLYRCYVS